MTEHYYTAQPTGNSEPNVFSVQVRGMDLSFRTDAGVFSKEHLDPGTRLLAETMSIEPGEDVLDLGAGYGPLGIVAACLSGTGRIVLLEINQRAVELARANMQLNKVKAEVLHSDGFSALSESSRFDCIITNPPIRAGKALVYSWFERSLDFLRPQGRLYAVMRTSQGAKSAQNKLAELFSTAQLIEIKGGYRVLCAIRR